MIRSWLIEVSIGNKYDQSRIVELVSTREGGNTVQPRKYLEVSEGGLVRCKISIFISFFFN